MASAISSANASNAGTPGTATPSASNTRYCESHIAVAAALRAVQVAAEAQSRAYAQAPTEPCVPLRALRFIVPDCRTGPREPLTLFHSTRVPRASLVDLCDSLAHRRRWFIPELASMALVLLQRYVQRTGLPVTALMMHRLFVACVLVAAKAHVDYAPTNRAVSQASGLALLEVTRLEAALLDALDWKVQVSKAEIDAITTQGLDPLPPPALARPPRRVGSSDDDLAAQGDTSDRWLPSPPCAGQCPAPCSP